MNLRLTSALVVVLLGTGALAGCAATPELSADAAKGLQTSVQTVASRAAAGDPAAAVTALDALQAQLDEAVANDEIDDERATDVQAKIDLVRADLTQRVAEVEAAAAAAEAQRIAAEQAEADRIAAEQAEAQRVAAEQAEADRLAQEKAANDAKNAKGDKGKGNDKHDDE